jgi:mannose-1-phosphate guanylyltransferase / mannose-6-phosphate isomerase
MTDRIVPVILSGGAGTRLWPASRESMPKQFMRLIGDRSTFQETVLRVSDPKLFDKPVVIAANDARFMIAEQLQEIGVAADIILEPVRRDSAPAVAVASEVVARRMAQGVALVMAADHVVRDAAAFVRGCLDAAGAARKGWIATLGIQPTEPHTGYGYIKPGEARPDTAAHAVARFVEKPDLADAERYLAEGYLWNGGYFIFTADTMQGELERYQPAVLAAARGALDKAVVDLDFIRLDEEAFSASPKISIDYAVMERTDKAAVVSLACGWSDVGTWGSVWQASEQDENGNATRGRVKVVGTTNSLVQSDDVLTCVVGLDDVVVVTNKDAVLVTSRARSGEVKDLVAQLLMENVDEATAHLRMHRPWGWYQRIEIGPRFQVKRIQVKPGARLSLQKHMHRAEHWVVVHGTAEVTVDDRVFLMHENEAAYLPIGCTHRLVNPGKIPLEIIEVQVGSYTGEDDIIRIEDVYGRGA